MAPASCPFGCWTPTASATPPPSGAGPGRDVYPLTVTGTSPRRFGLPSGYQGTSMATPHVSAAAALVIASHVLGVRPSPGAIEGRLERTARDLGVPGYDSRYGWGEV